MLKVAKLIGNYEEKKKNGKERVDYLLTKVPEDKKEAFVEDLKGVASLEEGLSVLKKYGISLTEEEMQKLTAKCEMSDNELDAAAGGNEYNNQCCMGNTCEKHYIPKRP